MKSELFQPTLYLGVGSGTYFHRSIGRGTFEVDLWIVIAFVPVFPLGIWVIRPRGIRTEETEEGSVTKFEFDFLGRRRLTFARVIVMILRVALHGATLLGPLVGSGIYAYWAHRNDPSVDVGPVFLAAFIWTGGLYMFWRRKRYSIYENNVSPTDK